MSSLRASSADAAGFDGNNRMPEHFKNFDNCFPDQGIVIGDENFGRCHAVF